MEPFEPPRQAGFLTLAPALPCAVCGTLTTTARWEVMEDGEVTLTPLCPNHRPGAMNGAHGSVS